MSDAATSWSVWKDIGYPGTVHVPGPGGKTRVYTFTRADWERIVATGRKKVREAWNVPTCWEHQDVGPTPAGRARLSENPDRDLALGVFARVRDFSMTPDGRAKALVTGTDPADYEQFKKVGFVSPEIAWDWTDTDGTVWQGPSVTHLAATARPVQRHQNPVGENPDRTPPGLRVSSLEKLVRMSFSGAAKPVRVAARLRLSLDHYRGGLAASGAKNMADETESGAKNPSPWERIAMALSAHCGIQLGDVTKINNPDEFARLVEVAAMNYKAGSEPEVPEEDDLPPEEEGAENGEQPAGDMEQPPPGAEEAPAPPVQMSLTEKKKADRIVAMEREKLVQRAERVRKNGGLAPADADEIVEECRTCRLSLNAEDRLAPCATITKLEAFEKVKPGATVPLKGKRGVQLSQNKRPRNTVTVDRSDYQEDGERDTKQVLAAWDATK